MCKVEAYRCRMVGQSRKFDARSRGDAVGAPVDGYSTAGLPIDGAQECCGLDGRLVQVIGQYVPVGGWRRACRRVVVEAHRRRRAPDQAAVEKPGAPGGTVFGHGLQVQALDAVVKRVPAGKGRWSPSGGASRSQVLYW